MATELFSNIEKLKELCRQGDTRINFNSHLDVKEIEIFEKAYGIGFSESYKQFLEIFNGGMILEQEIYFYTDMTDWEPDGPKHSSFYFFTLDELCDKYTEADNNNWLVDDEFIGKYPIIPICSSPKQELIFMISQKGIVGESPVFICRDSDDFACTKIANSFNTFLGFYIESDGFPALLKDDIEPEWEDFMNKHNIMDIANREETDEEIIERTNAYIQLFPKSGWSYNERGIAYRDGGQNKLALNDFNKSIKLNPEKAFFYYCRGTLIVNYGSKRKALIDFDVAVKLKPESKLFLSGRADALQKLGKLKAALADCNKVLDEDSEYTLALYVLERVYKAMGEDELAQVDSDLIDEIS